MPCAAPTITIITITSHRIRRRHHHYHYRSSSPSATSVSSINCASPVTRQRICDRSSGLSRAHPDACIPGNSCRNCLRAHPVTNRDAPSFPPVPPPPASFLPGPTVASLRDCTCSTVPSASTIFDSTATAPPRLSLSQFLLVTTSAPHLFHHLTPTSRTTRCPSFQSI